MTEKSAYIPAKYQDQAWTDAYTIKPFAADFESRKQAFFEQVLRNSPPPRGSKRAVFEVVRIAAGGKPDEGVIHQALTEFVERRQDCADFVMQAIIRILYQFGYGEKDGFSQTKSFHPQSLEFSQKSVLSFSPQLLAHAKAATLGFKFWPDEPGFDSMCTWTENHQILFSSTAYLAGQLFPNEIFTNSRLTGKDLMAVHRPRIDRWLEMRFKSGFSEWLSNVYYDEDWSPLLNLIDFAEDEELRERAKMIIDLSLFDMVLNSFRGVFGSTHGRSYEQNKKWATLEGTADTAKLIFGTGAFSAYDNMSAAFFALSERYQLPPVLYEIAHDPVVLENRQRMGHRIQDAERWELTYDDLESAMVFLSNEAYLHPKNANLTIKMFDAFNWWENDFFANFKPYRYLLYALRKLKMLPLLARLLEKDICRNMRQEANIYTYRTPDYMLSTVQDYRPGYGGDQQHIWQATLGPDAVCFTTHPVQRSDGTPDYWTGSGTLPRVAQIKNVVIAVYHISKTPGLYLTNNLFYTHAWLANDQFDDLIEHDNWIFARKDGGYLGLCSQQAYFWNEISPLRRGENSNDSKTSGNPEYWWLNFEDAGREIIAEGTNNIWICELGCQKDDGSFSQFVKKISQAEIRFKGLSVRYRSPSQGWLEFGWTGPFKKSGQVVPLENYPRYNNPYCQAAFLAAKIVIKSEHHQLTLDWQNLKRDFD